MEGRQEGALGRWLLCAAFFLTALAVWLSWRGGLDRRSAEAPERAVLVYEESEEYAHG